MDGRAVDRKGTHWAQVHPRMWSLTADLPAPPAGAVGRRTQEGWIGVMAAIDESRAGRAGDLPIERPQPGAPETSRWTTYARLDQGGFLSPDVPSQLSAAVISAWAKPEPTGLASCSA